MAQRSIKGSVELASGLGEMTRSAAKDAAAEFVAMTTNDLSAKKVTKQASRLADDLFAAANTNRKNLVALVRSEVDKAVGRLDVATLQQELSSVTDTVHALRSQVEELAGSLAGRSSTAASSAATGVATMADTAGATVADVAPGIAPAPSRRPARSALKKSASSSSSATKASATKASAKKASTATKTTAKKSTATTSTAKKSPAKKASTTKASTKKAPSSSTGSSASTAGSA